MAKSQQNSSVKVAIVGMTGSGKTVLISTLALKMSQMSLEDIFMAPFGVNRRETLKYVQSNVHTLQEGRWPPSTPSTELIKLQWELNTKNYQSRVQFVDCAGQDIRTLFQTDYFNPKNLSSDLKNVYDCINAANILIFLVNMEDLLASSDSVKELMDLDQMFHTLNSRNDIPRKMAVVFSQYDKYKPEVDLKFGGDFFEYLKFHLPYLHGQYFKERNSKQSFEIIPVAAVNDTQKVIENGEVKQYPAPNYSSYNLEKLIYWIANSVEDLAPEVEKYWKEHDRIESTVTTQTTSATQYQNPDTRVSQRTQYQQYQQYQNQNRYQYQNYYQPRSVNYWRIFNIIGILLFGIAGGFVGFMVYDDLPSSSHQIEQFLTFVLGGAIIGAFSFLALMFMIFWVIPGFIIGAWQGFKKGIKFGIVIGPIAGVIAAFNYHSEVLEKSLFVTVQAFLITLGVLVLIGAIGGGICGPKGAKDVFEKISDNISQ